MWLTVVQPVKLKLEMTFSLVICVYSGSLCLIWRAEPQFEFILVGLEKQTLVLLSIVWCSWVLDGINENFHIKPILHAEAYDKQQGMKGI